MEKLDYGTLNKAIRCINDATRQDIKDQLSKESQSISEGLNYIELEKHIKFDQKKTHKRGVGGEKKNISYTFVQLLNQKVLLNCAVFQHIR